MGGIRVARRRRRRGRKSSGKKRQQTSAATQARHLEIVRLNERRSVLIKAGRGIIRRIQLLNDQGLIGPVDAPRAIEVVQNIDETIKHLMAAMPGVRV
jgi:hypothetical protein